MKEQNPIPTGVAKSGRTWKVKQTKRFSSQFKKGVLSHMAKTFEEKEKERQKKTIAKDLEREMVEEKKRKKREEKTRREEQQKRRQDNEYKTTVYQQIKPEKLKGMSKKQLRSVKKTAVNKFGQVELVNPWGENAGKASSGKRKA
mmetsp:Transcript_3447/g.5374  ORF Transcript_3447/g.5374 Transcript_3447/m.5374 type:complete len:145 (+) Transcript_3447:35-469(+)